MTITIIGYYGFANAGDEAILASIVAQLRARRPDIRLIVSSGNCGATAAMHEVQAVAWNDVPALARSIDASDLVIIGGGGLFQDYWGVDPDTLLTNRHWGLSFWAGAAFLAKFYRKPLFLYAVGIGPLHSDYGVRLTRCACEAATAISVRDASSASLLREMDVSPEKIRVTADPVFALNLVPEGAGPIARRPVLGVSARPWSIGVHPQFLERELAAALDLFVQHTEGSVLFLPFQELRGEQEDDRAASERILTLSAFPNRMSILHPRATLRQLYGAIRGCDVIAAMRLHGVILAAKAGVPFVALSYDPKVEAAAGILGLRDSSIHVTAVRARGLANSLISALDSFGSAKSENLAALERACAEDCALALELASSPGDDQPISAASLEFLGRGLLANLRQIAELESGVTVFESRIAAFERENSTLRSSIADAEKRIQGFADENAALRHSLAGETARLAWADSVRAAAVAEMDRFQSTFERSLSEYKDERAWKIMLFIRKAYTMAFRRPASSLFKWLAGLPFGVGRSLEEYEPRFPDLRAYVPEHFRHSYLPAESAAGAIVPVEDTGSPPGNRYDVVILAIIDFDFRFQRPQQIAAEFARRGHRVFWVSPTRFLAPNAADPYETVPLRDNLWEIHLRSRQPDVYMGELQSDHVEAMGTSLSELFVDWGIAENVVLAQLPFWRKLALDLRQSQGSKVIYDCMDDWETFQNLGAFNISEEKEFVGECDVLVVTGIELLKKYQASGLRPVLARNGADFEFFAAARANNFLSEVPHPIVGYFGAIADWMDLDLVLAVARLRPGYSFVLIGQVFARDVTELKSLPNVFLLGSKRYDDLPSYLFHFDACLIPFLLNQVTRATDPVKLYEYFSLGKPVIATDMAELSQCADLLYVGRGSLDFAEKIDAALSEPDLGLAARRTEFAKSNTWAARVEAIDGAAVDAFPKVSVLVVTHNSEEFVRHCFESIRRNTAYPNFEVIAIDNASTDATASIVAEYSRDDQSFHFFPLSENTGFAAGNNFAAEKATGDYLVFLNVDTVVTSGWIHRLLEHFRRDPSVGLLCPVTNFAGNEAKINVAYADCVEMERFARARSREFRGQAISIDVAPLFCAMMPRAIWNRVGGLDASFGIGMFEDDDLALRVRNAGFRVAAAEDCFIHHFGQGSFSKLTNESYNRVFEANKSRFEEKWSVPWKPHRTRPGVKPAFEDTRFDPGAFRRRR